ncbi:sensor histidine kinase [Marinobacterium sp. BA1]|uniref:sensor histidine kinase n=1 Tax=Marinobacterium sp. BA1 TaxID=3138931 RepID=UPI0032E7C34C
MTKLPLESSDFTGQQELQQLMQLEKMATLGRLVAGVAHEINNPVCYVKTNLQTLTQYVAELDQLVDSMLSLADSQLDSTLSKGLAELKKRHDYDYLHAELPILLNETSEGVERIEGIVSNLRNYAHDDEDQKQFVCLQKLVETALRLVTHELKYTVRQIKREFTEVPEVWCRPAQMSQVLVNLFVNAAQAMPRGGDIYIGIHECAESRVEISVCDEGHGISEEIKTRLFEPFVTTKLAGKGTGLGLAICHEIMVAHGGEIRAENRPSGGACFTLTLPIKQS